MLTFLVNLSVVLHYMLGLFCLVSVCFNGFGLVWVALWTDSGIHSGSRFPKLDTIIALFRETIGTKKLAVTTQFQFILLVLVWFGLCSGRIPVFTLALGFRNATQIIALFREIIGAKKTGSYNADHDDAPDW